jgi:hypothetical protein
LRSLHCWQSCHLEYCSSFGSQPESQHSTNQKLSFQRRVMGGAFLWDNQKSLNRYLEKHTVIQCWNRFSAHNSPLPMFWSAKELLKSFIKPLELKPTCSYNGTLHLHFTGD